MNISISACLVVKFNYPITIKFFYAPKSFDAFSLIGQHSTTVTKKKSALLIETPWAKN